MAETVEERSARLLAELDALEPGRCADPANCRIHMTGCAVCGEYFEGQRYSGQLCSAPCRVEQRKRTRKANQEKKP